MDCVNHSGANATAYCQNCGKALCQACVKSASGGQVFCEPCMTAWSATANAQHPFYPAPQGAPSPGLAAFLGFIPGVGAMYNGQFLKGLVHVVIFAVLVSASHVFHLFGLLIAGWVFYQVFDAYHTAKARRDGEPLPDPLGLNEVGNWFGLNPRPPVWPQPGAGQSNPGQTGAGPASAYQYPGQAPFQNPRQQGSAPPTDWQTPYQGPYQVPYEGAAAGPGAAGTTGSPATRPVPPIPPIPPQHWRRREPIGAVILIALGVLFLLDRIDFLSGRVFEFSWPLVLIGLGVWLIVRRVEETRGGQK
jgi:TM2 domain-containing membrane protein YozV